MVAGALTACHSNQSRSPEPEALTIMANAAPGGVNSQMADWLLLELPEVSREIGAPVQFLPAGINDGDFKARIALDIKAGQGADVINLDQFWIPEFADAGFIMPLDRFLAGWTVKDEFYPPIREMGSFRGHVYQVMWNADIRMIFYHRELLAAAGVTLPWRPRSWEEIVAAAKKIKAARPGVIPLQLDAGTAMDEATTMQGFFMVFLGAGGRLYDPERDCWEVSSPALRRALEFYRRIYQEEKIADPELQIAPKAREKSFDLFSQGKIAIYVESTWFYTSVLNPSNASWGIPDRDQKIGWAPMPGGGRPGDPPFVSISGGDGLIVNPRSKHPELAWRLVAALNELPRQERLFLKKPFTPTRRDLAALPSVQDHLFISRAAAEIMPYTSFRPALPAYPEVSFYVQYLTERVATGQLGVEDALREFAASVENVVGADRTCRER
jgi:multiple sugar transport system substrate-binding protein